jgi:hypothetical protein
MRVAVIFTIIVALAGCGAQQTTLNGLGLPAIGTAGAGGAHAGTLMRPDAKEADLVYAADFNGNVWVYTFPALKLAGELTGLDPDILGLCSDAKGHVFIPAGDRSGGGKVLEFAHGGTTPIATISDQYRPQQCAVDPTTGNLAVTNVEGSYVADVAVYANIKRAPKIYRDPNIGYFWSVGHDNAGNLFADGQNSDQIRRFATLPKGAKTFTDISVNESLRLSFAVQWDGRYITIARMPGPGGHGPHTGCRWRDRRLPSWERRSFRVPPSISTGRRRSPETWSFSRIREKSIVSGFGLIRRVRRLRPRWTWAPKSTA